MLGKIVTYYVRQEYGQSHKYLSRFWLKDFRNLVHRYVSHMSKEMFEFMNNKQVRVFRFYKCDHQYSEYIYSHDWVVTLVDNGQAHYKGGGKFPVLKFKVEFERGSSYWYIDRSGNVIIKGILKNKDYDGKIDVKIINRRFSIAQLLPFEHQYT